MLRKKRWLSMMERCLKRVAEGDANCVRLNQIRTTVEAVCWQSESYVQYVYNICTYVHVCAYVGMCMFACVYVCMHVCVHVMCAM